MPTKMIPPKRGKTPTKIGATMGSAGGPMTPGAKAKRKEELAKKKAKREKRSTQGY